MHKVYSRPKFESAVPILRGQRVHFEGRRDENFRLEMIHFPPTGGYFGPYYRERRCKPGTFPEQMVLLVVSSFTVFKLLNQEVY